MWLLDVLSGSVSEPEPVQEQTFRGIPEHVLNEKARRVHHGREAYFRSDGTLMFNYASNRGKPMGPIPLRPDPDGRLGVSGGGYPGQTHFPVDEFCNGVNDAAVFLEQHGELPFDEGFMREARNHAGARWRG